jgi:acyl-CoA thioesterase-1
MPLAFCVALAAMVLSGCSNYVAAATAPSQIPQTRRIVAFGDSLTSGHGLASKDEAYPAVLQRMLHAAGLPFVVSNHGVAGETTVDAVERLDAALAEQPDIMIVALGANDGIEGVPLRTVRANLEKIIEEAQERDIEVLLCGMEALPLHGFQYFLGFHRMYQELADEYDVPLVPFFLAGVIGNRDLLLPDLVHPNAAGAAQIAQAIWPHLLPLAKALVPVVSVFWFDVEAGLQTGLPRTRPT